MAQLPHSSLPGQHRHRAYGLVNRVPLTLPDCYDGPQESCSREFMQGFVRERAAVVGDFSEKCEVDYNNSTDVLNIYTRNTTGKAVGK
jgi:acid phosphatase